MGPCFMGWGGMWIFPTIGIILCAICFIFLCKKGRNFWCLPCNCFGKGFMNEKGSESPVEVLNMRYAKGEITKEEYDRMKNDILGKH